MERKYKNKWIYLCNSKNHTAMADNFLEKRYDEVFGKNAGTRKTQVHATLDTLLKSDVGQGADIPDYPVSPVQTEKIIAAGRSVKPIGGSSPEISSDGAKIILKPGARPASDTGTDTGAVQPSDDGVNTGAAALIDLGRAVEAVCLKAADLALSAVPTVAADGTVTVSLCKRI